MDDDTRETAVFLAKMAERTERYDEMVEAMKVVAKMNVQLTGEERRLLALGFKHVVVARRNARIILSSMETEEAGSQVNVGRIQVYKGQMETEIIDISVAVTSILENHLLPSSTSPDDAVFYYKMMGDYFRYCAEFKTGEDKKQHADEALAIYEKATKIAEKELPRANPTRLNLALNFSVLFWEILVIPQRAFEIAQTALDEGFPEVLTLNEESKKASMEVMRLIRDNITLWRHEMEEISAAKNDGGEGSSSAAVKGKAPIIMLDD